MALFKGRKMAIPIPAVWQRVQTAVNNRQHQLADYLQRQSLKISRTALYIWFAVFCLISGSASVLVVVRAFKGDSSKSKVISISVPKYVAPPESKGFPGKGDLSNIALQSVQLLRRRIDSLKIHNRQCYDSIMQVRPGLLDSIRQLEQFYSKSYNNY